MVWSCLPPRIWSVAPFGVHQSVSQSDSESDWQNSELTFSRGGGGGDGGGPLSVRDDDLRG